MRLSVHFIAVARTLLTCQELFWASLVAQTVKKICLHAGDAGSIPGLGRSTGEANGNALQYSCLDWNSMDRGAWLATVHGVTKSWTQLYD